MHTLGQATRIGRFRVETAALGTDGRTYVSFAVIGEDGYPGPVFGEISLEAACTTPVVDLYESAGYRLGLGIIPAADIDRYCLDDTEIESLHEWARGIAEARERETASDSEEVDDCEPSTGDVILGAVGMAAILAIVVGIGVGVAKAVRLIVHR